MMHWLTIALFAVVLSGGWYHATRVGQLETQVAELKGKAAAELTAREKAAREHAEQLLSIRSKHAEAQQEKEDAHAKTLDTLAKERAARTADVRWLRHQLASATARGRPGADADPAACERDQARLEVLGRLAGEGAELLEEARGLLRERDAQLTWLSDLLANDRAAMLRSHTPRSADLPAPLP